MRKSLVVLGILGALLTGPALAGVELKEDGNYKVVSLERSEKPKVIEFFSYGCPHCYRFEPFVQAWLKTKPEDVSVLRVPVAFHDEWKFYAQAYYVADVLKVLDKTHEALFDHVHKDGQHFKSEDDIVSFYESLGIPGDSVRRELNGFAVKSKLAQADHLIKKYQVLSVPSFVVNDQLQVLMKDGEHPDGLTLENLGEGLNALVQKP